MTPLYPEFRFGESIALQKQTTNRQNPKPKSIAFRPTVRQELVAIVTYDYFKAFGNFKKSLPRFTFPDVLQPLLLPNPVARGSQRDVQPRYQRKQSAKTQVSLA